MYNQDSVLLGKLYLTLLSSIVPSNIIVIGTDETNEIISDTLIVSQKIISEQFELSFYSNDPVWN